MCSAGRSPPPPPPLPLPLPPPQICISASRGLRGLGATVPGTAGRWHNFLTFMGRALGSSVHRGGSGRQCGWREAPTDIDIMF